jgi:1-acyl-sn-glycerol-3-phosphate acyltransferase
MTLRHLFGAVYETAKVSVPTLAEVLVGWERRERYDARLLSWADNLLRRAKVSLAVTGVENAARGEAFVVMSNHQSLYDVPVIFSALRRPIRMVTKAELFRIPIWGRAMREAGFIEVDRGDHERAVQSMQRASEAFARGMNIWISPEGTRSRDGSLGAFRKGGFHLALEAGARILPVGIDGTRQVLPAKGRTVRPGANVAVTICPPVDPRDFGSTRLDALVDHVRRAIVRARVRPDAG